MNGRLVGWTSFVLIYSALNYTARYAAPEKRDHVEVAYRYEFSIAAIVQYAVLLLIVLLLSRGLDRRSFLALRRPTSWGQAAWIGLAVIAVLFVLTAALSPFVNAEKEQGLTPEHWDSHRVWQFALFAGVVTLVGPFVEELLFRGAGFSLLERFGSRTAIVGVGLAFGLVHGLVAGFVIIAAFGIGLAYLRSRTGSIYPCMLLHACFNAVAVTIGVTT